MKSKYVFFVIAACCALSFLNAQSTDTIQQPKIKSFLKKSILPAGLITVGSVLNKSQFERDFQTEVRNRVGNDFHNPIDDYTQFAPVVLLYGAKFLKVPAKNDLYDITKNVVIANTVNFVLTITLKEITDKTRPYGGENAFPSGHTSFAFTNATILYEEFKETAPVLAYSGFAFATTTAAFRVINNKHWLSDVIVGAGLGILVTEAVYSFEPLKKVNPFKEKFTFAVVPQFTSKTFGAYVAYRF